MLKNGGRIVKQTGKDTPYIPMLPSSYNDRLIRQLSNFLKDAGIEHSLETLSGRVNVTMQNIDGQSLRTLLIYSNPCNGLSYVEANLLRDPSIYGTQLRASFIAHSPLQIVSKLGELDMLKFFEGRAEL